MEKKYTEAEVKKIVQFVFDQVLHDLKEIQDVNGQYRDITTIDEMIQVYSDWPIDGLLDAQCVKSTLIL